MTVMPRLNSEPVLNPKSVLDTEVVAGYLQNVAHRERVLTVAQSNIQALGELPLREALISPLSVNGQVRNVEDNLKEHRAFSSLPNREEEGEALLLKNYKNLQLWDDTPRRLASKSDNRRVEALLDPEDRSLATPLQLETLSFPSENGVVKGRFQAALSYLYPRELVQTIERDIQRPCKTSTFVNTALKGEAFIRERVGGGACGEVFRVTINGEDFAVKEAKGKFTSAMMANEMRANLIVAQDPETPIVQLVAISKESMVMEYIQGAEDFLTLFEKPPHSATDEQVVIAIRTMVDGLKHLEAQGVCHKDIKFENCILTPSGGVKLMDFGFSEAIGVVPIRILGTTGYQSPEVLRREANSIQSDVYALGVALSKYVNMRPPVEGDDEIGEMLAIIAQDCCNEDPVFRMNLQGIDRCLEVLEEELFTDV